MKTHVSYECEICRMRYRSAESAAECEARGRATPVPVGLLHIEPADGFYGEKLAFAVAECHLDGHGRYASLWACRDNGAGDSLGKDQCGNGNSYHPEEFHPEYLERPPVKRLLAWMDAEGIEPLVFVGGEIKKLRDAIGGAQ